VGGHCAARAGERKGAVGSVVAIVKVQGGGGAGGGVSRWGEPGGRTGGRVAVLIEGDVVGHIWFRDLLEGKEGVARSKLRVSWDKNWGHYRGLHAFVVVGVDADLHLFGVEGEVADVHGFELVVGLQVRPTPHSAVDHVGKTFTMRNLKPSI